MIPIRSDSQSRSISTYNVVKLLTYMILLKVHVLNSCTNDHLHIFIFIVLKLALGQKKSISYTLTSHSSWNCIDGAGGGIHHRTAWTDSEGSACMGLEATPFSCKNLC